MNEHPANTRRVVGALSERRGFVFLARGIELLSSEPLVPVSLTAEPVFFTYAFGCSLSMYHFLSLLSECPLAPPRQHPGPELPAYQGGKVNISRSGS